MGPIKLYRIYFKNNRIIKTNQKYVIKTKLKFFSKEAKKEKSIMRFVCLMLYLFMHFYRRGDLAFYDCVILSRLQFLFYLVNTKEIKDLKYD